MTGRRPPGVSFVRALFELGGVVALRFRPLPRVFAIWLVVVNAAAVGFIDRIEAQVVLLAVVLALAVQAMIYRRWGFVRLLGASHAVWLLMVPWLVTRLGSVPAEDGLFHAWLVALIVTNAMSLVIDAADVARFVHGEREPHYRW